MKIVLIGTCQVVGMAAALRAMIPEATVDAYHLRPDTRGMQDILLKLPMCDLVISQILHSHKLPLFTIDRLERMGIPHLEMIPPLAFDGFHPDLHIIADGLKQLESPIEVYHSLILAASYLLGVPEAQAINLFNRLIYKRLGYGTLFNASKQALIENLKSQGYDTVLEENWAHWADRGCFMYTPNHPRIDVLASFAKMAAVRAGLIERDTAIPGTIPDVLAPQHAWAVYPELAEEFGVLPDMTFKRFKRGTMSEIERNLDLATFTNRSYEIYRRTDRTILVADKAVRETAEIIGGALCRTMPSAIAA